MVAGRGEVFCEAVAGLIDLVLTGPRATAAMPPELAPLLEEGITGRRWDHDVPRTRSHQPAGFG